MKSYDRLWEIIMRLRAPDGCPWDREQTPKLMRGDLLEEVYELIEAIDEEDPAHVAEEIGDVVLVASMIGYMYQQENLFSMDDVFNGISDKLVRRHPHVFDDVGVEDSAEVIRNWNRIKRDVEGRNRDGVLDGIPTSFPPLERVYKMQRKAAGVGFDWVSSDSVWGKISEESMELKEVLSAVSVDPDRVMDECGDLLFSVVNLCRKLGCDPSIALDHASRKFQRRFNFVERSMVDSGLVMESSNLSKMDEFWDSAKIQEKNRR